MRPLVWLGGTGYFIYLFHQPVNSLVHWVVARTSPTLITALGFAVTSLTLVILFGLAELSRRFSEQPLIAFGHRFTVGVGVTLQIADRQFGDLHEIQNTALLSRVCRLTD